LPRWGLPALLVATVLAAAAATAARSADWKDDETLGRASIRDDPDAPLGYMLAGNWHVREGDKDEALRLFNDGLAHVPESVELQQYAIGLGIQLGHLTQEDAVRAYERLVPLASGSAPAQFNLGQALLQNGRLDQAKVAFERALALSPNSAPSMTALAVVASKQGDDATAIAWCRRALAIDDHSTAALQQLGVALLRQGDLAGAVATFERAVRLDPSDKDSLNRLGVAYVRSGRRDDARRAWEGALAIDPQFDGARQNLERLRQMAQ
jgi:Flp pilus assembly protein TadD